MVFHRFSMGNAIKKATLLEMALYFLGRRKVFLVEGDSMIPTLANGDKVLIRPAVSVTVGDLVVAEHPYRSDVKVVKRVGYVSGDGRLTLVGDNPTESSDSRTFGTVSIESIIGNVVSKL